MDITIFDELKSTGNLPTPAGVGIKILQITESDDYEVAEMSRAIMADSSLTGRILQLANSTAFGSQQPATTVDESIMRLGSASVRNLSLAFSLVSERKPGTCKAFDYAGYWSASLARAVTAQVLSAKMGIGRPEEAYICGLLSNIGRLALASVFPELYAELIVESQRHPCTGINKFEQERFDIDHIQVAACMAADWKLPKPLGEAIQQSLENPEIAPNERAVTNLADVLRLANAIASALALDESATPDVWAYAGEQFRNARLMLGSEEFDFPDSCNEFITDWVSWGHDLQVATQPQRNIESLESLITSKTAEHDQRASEEPSDGNPAGLESTHEKRSTSTVYQALNHEAAPPTSILLVDDEPVSLKILQMQLHQKGYEVLTATSGKEALKIALELCPDIVIADWQMPEMNGMDLCRSLRRSNERRDVYFLLVTGSGGDDVIVEAFDAGVDDFVTKPFLPQVMGARIKGGERLVQLNRKVENDKRTMRRQVAELGVLTRKLRATSLTDALTDLPNRRYALKRLKSVWSALERVGHNLTLMMIDIDHFKSVNDDYGHDIGDLVLKETANVFKGCLRASDEICRIGGEEFLLICKDTSEEESLVVAERLRANVQAHTMPLEHFDRELTISLGIAEYDPGMTCFNELMKLADEALYSAKNNGRNRFVRYSEIKSTGKAA